MDLMNMGAAHDRAPVLDELGLVLKPVVSNDDVEPQDLILVLPDGSSLPVTMNSTGRWEYFRNDQNPRVVIQPYVNPRMAERYREQEIFYIDFAGNAWLWTEHFKVFIDGRRPSTTTESHTANRAFSTPSELRVIFLLLNDPEYFDVRVREIAQRSLISVGAAQKAIHSLRDNGFIPHGKAALRREDELSQLWLGGFTARLLPKLRARTMTGCHPERLLAEMEAHSLDAVPAGEAVAPVMSSKSSVTIYGMPPWSEVTRVGRLKLDDQGQITLRECFWNPTIVKISPRGQNLLTCGELLASPDERLREAGYMMQRRMR